MIGDAVKLVGTDRKGVDMCPSCGKPMVVFEFEGVEIDRCIACRGTWLDSGELARILEQGGSSADAWRSTLDSARLMQKSTRRCPRCPRKLQEIRVETDPSVTLDRCPWGDGLWFEGGEMQTIIHSFADEGVVPHFFAGLYQVETSSKQGGE